MIYNIKVFVCASTIYNDMPCRYSCKMIDIKQDKAWVIVYKKNSVKNCH